MLCAKFGWNWYNGSWEDFYQGCNQVWLKLAQWLWRIRYLNFVNVFSLFRNYLPWKRVGSFIWTNINPLHFTQECLLPSVLKLAQWFWRRWKCEKFTTTTTTDNGQTFIREAHLSLRLRWAKKHKIYTHICRTLWLVPLAYNHRSTNEFISLTQHTQVERA